jgi:hypothetical protein
MPAGVRCISSREINFATVGAAAGDFDRSLFEAAAYRRAIRGEIESSTIGAFFDIKKHFERDVDAPARHHLGLVLRIFEAINDLPGIVKQRFWVVGLVERTGTSGPTPS